MCDHKDTESPVVARQLRRVSMSLLGFALGNGLVLFLVCGSWAGILASMTLCLLLPLPGAIIRHPFGGPLLVDGLLLLIAVALLI